jgi:hypothetical protein
MRVRATLRVIACPALTLFSCRPTLRLTGVRKEAKPTEALKRVRLSRVLGPTVLDVGPELTFA